ncbi:MAG TPA: hypothetical protein DDY98_04980 [Ruminococcaceae bacterium]|nr:hypothetical protein [Oscillospiraceae bacterium]
MGAYFKNDEESGNIVVNQDAMRLTQNNGGSYSAAPEVSGIVGTVSYSLNSPLSNSFLVRTVNDVKVRKTFTLSYVLRGDTDIGDKTVITVENVLDGSPMATTGLAQISSATNLTGTICENMLLQPTDNTYVLRAYADIGAGKTVESAKVQPAYVNNSGTVFSNLAVGGDVSDPTLSSFTAVSSTIGPDEDSGIRYTHLLITVTIQDIDEWGLQRTGWGVNFRR